MRIQPVFILWLVPAVVMSIAPFGVIAQSPAKPKIDRVIPFNTPEADAILAALKVFPADNPWNTRVDEWPLHPNSKAMIAAIGGSKPLRYNPDMSFVLVPPDQKMVEVKLDAYAEESDQGPYPVPDNAVIEGWPANFQRDPATAKLTLEDIQRGKPNLDSDRHGIVVDPVNRKLYEFYRLTKTDTGWKANRRRCLTSRRTNSDPMVGRVPMQLVCRSSRRSCGMTNSSGERLSTP